MFARFFVDRPIAATVLSVVIVLLGLVALETLPIAQYPEVAPPTVQVTAFYPGANANVVADTVATPIEQEVNGVEGMIYMSSSCTNDGNMVLNITFELGTDLDMAQVLVQNRVAIAESKLPEDVRRQGVTTKKKSPSILLCINLISPKNSRDQLYLSNRAIDIKDSIARLKGVGDVTFLGSRDYSMRVWLDPDKLASRNMTADDIVNALREQNIQVAAGRIGQPPVSDGIAFDYPISTLGRLIEAEEFADVVIKTGDKGQITRLKDVARVELGAKNSDVNSYLDGKPSITLAVFQLPGANALATAESIRAEMEKLKKSFPSDVDYKIIYDTTIFINESVHEVYKTLFEAFILVFIVVLFFLQDWRATLMPMIDVPVSLIGTFCVMALMGFSLNNLSLFGLVLAIGIVVDDAIVVVENIERWMAKGLPPREATIKAMDEITGPVIAITLVLSAVFIPTAFIAGISGQFYRQFALTIATATIISAINALTMAPARAVQLIKPHTGEHAHETREALPNWGIAILAGLLVYWLLGATLASWLGLTIYADEQAAETLSAANLGTLWAFRIAVFAVGAILGWIVARPINFFLGGFFQGFNRIFDIVTKLYGRLVGGMLRVSAIVLLIYAGLLGMTYMGFKTVPAGFIPEQDKGYLVLNAQLPDGASLQRTEAAMKKIDEIVRSTEGVYHTIRVPGFSIITNTNLTNVGGMFIILVPFEERKHDAEKSAKAIAIKLRGSLMAVQEAQAVVFGAPPIDGLGNTGGFKFEVQDKGDLGFDGLEEAVAELAQAGNAQPGLVGLFSSFRANQPQLYIDIDRTKVKSLGMDLNQVFDALQVYLGSAYVNDFTRFNRNWQVNVQADSNYRARPDDIGKLKVRNNAGAMIPLQTLISVRDITGPAIVNHYNKDTSAEINGNMTPGTSSGQAIALMEELAQKHLPEGAGYEWTELMYQEIKSGNTAVTVFALGTLLVFLVLCFQYESWTLPMAIILIVPMCLLAAITGVWLCKMDNNIFTQIGLVVLIGLAAKNAILVVEFAKERHEEGMSLREAAMEASRTRLRPILMTSFAFILGVVPLATAAGAGAEMRQALGIAVFSGMLGVTCFGLLLTPVFYFVIGRFTGKKSVKD
jgi:multidrug efflux pump